MLGTKANPPLQPAAPAQHQQLRPDNLMQHIAAPGSTVPISETMGQAYRADGQMFEDAPTSLGDPQWDIPHDGPGAFDDEQLNYGEEEGDWSDQEGTGFAERYINDAASDDDQDGIPLFTERVGIRLYGELRGNAIGINAKLQGMQAKANSVGDAAMWGLCEAALGIINKIQKLAEGGVMHYAELVSQGDEDES